MSPNQKYFNTTSGLVQLNYIAVMFSITVDFISADLNLMSSIEDKEKILAQVQRKLDYLQYLSGSLVNDVSKCFPQGSEIHYTVNRLLQSENVQSAYNLVSPPPEPFNPLLPQEAHKPFPSTFTKPMTVAKNRKLTLMGYKHLIPSLENHVSAPTLPTLPIGPVVCNEHLTADTDANSNHGTTNTIPIVSTQHVAALTEDSTVNNDESNTVSIVSPPRIVANGEATSNNGESNSVHQEFPTLQPGINTQLSTTEKKSNCCFMIEMYLRVIDEYKLNKNLVTASVWLDERIAKNDIPVSRATFFRLLKKYSELKKEDDALANGISWSLGPRGRRYIVPTMEDVPRVMNRNSDPDKVVDLANIASTLEIERRQQMNIPQSHFLPPIKCRTAKRYRAVMASSDEFKVRNKVQYKNKTREISERSPRSAVSALLTYATTHYILTSQSAGVPTKKLPPIKDATLGAQKLYNLVQKCNPSMKIYPVDPALVTSTDDTTLYAYAGTEEDVDEWVLVPSYKNDFRVNNSNDDVSTKRQKTGDGSAYSKYTTNPHAAKKLDGQRVRLTTTFSAAGLSAPIFATIYGLSERELPKDKYPDGVFIVKVPGLSIGGTQDVYNDSFGFIILARKGAKKDPQDKSPDCVGFQKYHGVLKEFLRKVKNVQYGTSNDISVPTEEVDQFKRSVCWCDGGNPQIAAFKDPEINKMWDLEQVVCNKHSAATSTTSQPCDLAKSYKNLKIDNKKTTALDTPNLLRKAQFEKVFTTLERENGICVNHKKRKHLVDFLLNLPSMMTKATSPSILVHAFERAGAIDTKSKTWVDMDAVLNTCKNPIINSVEMRSLIEDNFEVLYQEQISTGMISEALFDSIGFPKDKDSKGNVYERDVSDKNEGCHRAKTFTHSFWNELRSALLKAIQENKQTTVLLSVDKCLCIHVHNVEAENYLRSILPYGPYQQNKEFESLSVENFFHLKVNQLRAFIYVRTFNEFHIRKNVLRVETKKGKLEDVLNGSPSIVKEAHSIRMKPVILEEAISLNVRLNNSS